MFNVFKVKKRKENNNWIEKNKAIAVKSSNVIKKEKELMYKQRKEKDLLDKEKLL